MLVKNYLSKIILFLSVYHVVFAPVCYAKTYHFASIKNLPQQKIGGFVVPEIFKKAGLNVFIEPLPGKRAEMMAKKGRLDGEIMRIYSHGDENPNLIRVPTEYLSLETRAYYLSNRAINIKRVKDLERYKIATRRGVKHTDLIVRKFPEEQIFFFNNSHSMMDFLLSGRADVALTSSEDGRAVLSHPRYNDIVRADVLLATKSLHIYVHKKNAHIVPLLDATVKTMKASGELDILIEKARLKK